MDNEQVENRVKQLFSQHLRVGEDDYRLHARIGEDLGADSLKIVKMVIAFEEAFEIDISEEDAQDVKTIGDAVALVKQCLLAQSTLVAKDT